MRPAFLVKEKKNQEKEAARLITGKFLRQRIALKLLLNVLEPAGLAFFFMREGWGVSGVFLCLDAGGEAATCSALPSHLSMKWRAGFTAGYSSRWACFQSASWRSSFRCSLVAAMLLTLQRFIEAFFLFPSNACVLVICGGSSESVKGGRGVRGGLSGGPPLA